MKKHLAFLSTLSLLLFLSACRPDVEACFSNSIIGTTVTFSSNCAIEADSYEWDFGDGGSSVSPNPTHYYSSEGEYEVLLNVSDKKGRRSSTTNLVEVACAQGFEGPNCTTMVNQKFAGAYALNENCSNSGYNGPYSVSVITGATAFSIQFVGLWEVPSVMLNATIDPDGSSFTIPQQALDSFFSNPICFWNLFKRQPH